MHHYDDVVVGAGIVGRAHAYHSARRGRRVVVIERGAAATGTSVRNFGMLWPIGQPFGERRTLGLRSLEIWLEVLASAGLAFERAGSRHLAYYEDEAQVLREYADLAGEAGQPVEVLSGPESKSHSTQGSAGRSRK
jgi:glycine/D-amino acid oxidase-like deaminating enzyme